MLLTTMLFTIVKISTPSQWIAKVMKIVEYQFTGGKLLPFILNLIFLCEYYAKAWQERWLG